MPFVSVTRLQVRAWRFLPAFLLLALRSSRQARRAAGNLETSLLTEARRAFWTVTVWTDETAMRSFMAAGAHATALRKLRHWCDEGAVVHWSQERAEAPSWREAHRRLQAEGRPSKVLHPTAAHEAYHIRPPVLRRGVG